MPTVKASKNELESATQLYCDGASRGNPGPSAYGYAIIKDGEIIAQQSGCLGATTNNVAEYEGLVRGLSHCLKLGVKNLIVKSDSELLVRQLNGLYRVKSPKLILLYQTAQDLLKQLVTVNLIHIPRNENKLSDSLANQALDHQIALAKQCHENGDT